ncbi:MAG TPA: DUF4259 domain-containing protein [Rhizomicrobium sp.]|nr:DUF4259 domain-containing protein [Rhizomicrobium sp.]
MGAWGKGALENDDACDYADMIADGKDLSGLERTLDTAIQAGEDYLEVSDGAEALAAGEIVARLLGRPGALTPRTAKIDEWISGLKQAPGAPLVDKAVQAVTRVMTEPSELMEIWIDSDNFDDWQDGVEDLLHRLKP